MVAPKGSETALKRYASKRDFSVTPEPAPTRTRKPKALSFVVQKHWASRLHYDLRLELDGVLLSWAVPKGPCFDPHEKRMAIHVEDHPVPYGSFEGTIPPKQYGAGTVMVWDNGTWEPVGDPQDGMREGKLVFRLHGQKLAGLWELVRIAKPGDRQEAWILFKKRDEWARPLAEYDVIAALPDSVIDHPLGPLEEREPRVEIRTQALPSPPLVADTLAGAVKAVLPQTLPPQLATRAEDLPSQGRWRYELKLDGYRLLARIDHRGDARLITRQGNDWTDRMESLAADVKSLGLSDTWLDGEIVVLDDKGVPSFNALQNAFDVSRTRSIVYFVFDMPFCEGYDLRQVPWEQRRALLKQLLGPRVGERVRLSEDFDADPRSLLESVRKLGMEGLIAKRVDAPYASRRAETWLKIKLQERQEFVVGGFTERGGGKGEVGSMLLGYYDDQGRLLQAGSVGTGWNAKTGRALFQRLVAIETDVSPFTEGGVQPGRWSRRAAGSERWVKPELVAEVSFAEWTPDGHIRHAIFEGLRDDKPAAEIRREKAASVAPSSARPLVTPRVGSVKVSNPERVIDPSTGLKKLDLVRYYESVAEWMLPHLKGRPVSLVRGPNGIGGELFFQKHDDKLSIAGMRELDPSLWPGHAALLELPSAQALVNAAQMNVVEFHTWNSTVRSIDQPDRVVFDLDPGEGVSWLQVQEAALLTRTLLEELGLKAWLKTSGGKGLHVIAPIVPRLDYDAVKDFALGAVQHLARTIPSRFVARSGASNRVGRIFVDYLRNSRGATTAAAFSARARPGLGVSMPVAWDQLMSLKSGAQWTIATAREHLSFQKQDPWADYWSCRQSLAAAIKRLR